MKKFNRDGMLRLSKEDKQLLKYLANLVFADFGKPVDPEEYPDPYNYRNLVVNNILELSIEGDRGQVEEVGFTFYGILVLFHYRMLPLPLFSFEIYEKHDRWGALS